MLLVNSGGPGSLAEWQRCFEVLMPSLPVAFLGDPAVDADAVSYVLVYEPPIGCLARFRNLRLVISAGAGVDHITKDPLWPRHLPLVRMSSAETARRMSEYVCLAALSLLRGMKRAMIAQHACTWDHFETARGATETTVGIMGLGNVGLPSARMLKQLGFKVVGWTRTPKDISDITCYVGDGEREAFLSRSDILVCLLPGTAETHNIIRADTIRMLPRGAGLVNASRGSNVNTTDLLVALDEGQLGGAVLDVFDEEPLPANNILWRHPRVLVTPHIAALATRYDRAAYASEVIKRFEAGIPVSNLYDPIRGY
jgi:glyoxylate/hydroxypyruvate reductase